MAEQATGAANVKSAQFPSRTSISVRLGENVNLETLQNIVARITNLTGCTGCGLLGVDLHLGGDPVEFKQMQQIPGVRTVSFGG